MAAGDKHRRSFSFFVQLYARFPQEPLEAALFFAKCGNFKRFHYFFRMNGRIFPQSRRNNQRPGLSWGNYA